MQWSHVSYILIIINMSKCFWNLATIVGTVVICAFIAVTIDTMVNYNDDENDDENDGDKVCKDCKDSTYCQHND
jgi:hypothetical protein